MGDQATSMQEISADRSNEHIKITLNRERESVFQNLEREFYFVFLVIFFGFSYSVFVGTEEESFGRITLLERM